MSGQLDPLTADEQRAIALTAELSDALDRVVADGPSRTQDLLELQSHIHAVQHAVMANHLARARPHQFRVLGGAIVQSSVDPCPEWRCPDLSTEARREGRTCPDHPCTCSTEQGRE